MKLDYRTIVGASVSIVLSAQTYAEDVEQISNVEIAPVVIDVISITPVLGVGLPVEKIPYNVQSSSGSDLEQGANLDITDFMERSFNSVNINEAANNPLQPDLQYRGFTASPLLGLPQGLAVYQNGVRMNEVFGDTINWDLIPEGSIHSMNLIGGSNPVFGLNTLGGTISIETKNGFNFNGTNVELYNATTHDRNVFTFETGGNDGTVGYYGTVQHFDEQGWRDASPSDALNFFGALSYRDDYTTSLDLNVNYANTDLIGNGAIPIEFANLDYDGIFTSPDQTLNEVFMVQAQGAHWFNDDRQISGNAFYRRTKTETFNGDGTEFEECTVDGVEVLVEADEDDLEGLNCAGGITSGQLAAIGGEVVENQNGAVSSEANTGFEPDDLNGLQNRSDRTQKYYGFTLQNAFYDDLFDKTNQLITGAGYTYGDVVFNSSQELALLNADRSTRGTNNFVPDEGTAVDSEVSTMSLFFTDTFSATDKLDLTFSTRWNHTNVKLTDKGGRGFTRAQPRLTGEHEFHRVNPAAGITYKADSGLNSYFSYSESSRAPTAVELACAEPTAPCSLPNGFLADPPLDQVVAKSYEGGFRGSMSENVRFKIGAFYTPINNDIIFQNTGGVSGNQGFFDNVSDTLRQGVELSLTGASNDFDWFLNYSLVQATFESTFQVTSANHTLKDGNDLIQVQAGDFIPGIPEHTLKLGGDYSFNQAFSIGGDLQYNSGVFVRGDESNQLGRLDDYETINIRSRYQFNETFKIFGRVDNLLDEQYHSFGLLGEPNEVPGFAGFTDNRFVGVGAPRSIVVGVSASF